LPAAGSRALPFSSSSKSPIKVSSFSPGHRARSS
jgi:hypothetical protein